VDWESREDRALVERRGSHFSRSISTMKGLGTRRGDFSEGSRRIRRLIQRVEARCVGRPRGSEVKIPCPHHQLIFFFFFFFFPFFFFVYFFVFAFV